MAKGNIFIDRRVAAMSISILTLLVGFISLVSLSVEQYPDIAPPTINVSTTYDGADANTVMNSVIIPLEEAIKGVENMSYITSQASSTGEAEIKVYFKQGTNPDMCNVNVQNRIQTAMGLMPSEVTKVGVTVEKKQNSLLQIIGIKSSDGKFDTDFLTNFVDINIKPRLLRIPGIGNVTLCGNTYSLRIWLKPDQMARYNLVPDDIFNALNSQNIIIATGSLGDMSDNAIQYTMEYKGRLQTLKEFEDIVIRSTSMGEVLRLKDVGSVELGAIRYTFSSDVDQMPGTLFMMYQTAGANATQVNAQINEVCKNIEKQLPPGVVLETLMCTDDFLYAAIDSVVETLIIAILLVILVVFFFLQDFRATVIPSLSIIVALMGTFAVIKVAGFSLNILTLFALVLSIGTVVDDAIVVVEAVMAKMESGYTSARKATMDAMSEVTMAVFSCTLVFMAVFIPVTFMPGTSGTFFTQFGVTIASAVGLSCLNALTLCPALCAVMLRAKDKKENGIVEKLTFYVKKAYTASYSAIFNKYTKVLEPVLKRPAIAWSVLIISGTILGWLMVKMPTGLVPQEDQGTIMIDVSAPAGTSLHDTELLGKQIENIVKAQPEVEYYALVTGFGMISGNGTNKASVFAKLKHWEERKGKEHYIETVMSRINAACEPIKDASVVVFQMPQIPGYGTSNTIEFMLQNEYGEPMDKFKGIADKYLAALRNRPEIGLAMTTYADGYPKFKVDVDAAQCERSGIMASDVLKVLGSYCGGSYIGNYNQYGKVYRVMVAANYRDRLAPSDLANMFVRIGDKMAPLSQFVTLTPMAGSDSQRRFNLFLCFNCQAMAAPGYSDGDAQRAMAEVAKEYLPTGYSYDFGGMSRELAENAKSNMTGIIYIICVFLIYLILCCLYESWFLPFAVLLSVPCGLMGSFLCSYLVGFDNNVYLQTGVIMLIGLLAKTAILITEFAVEYHKKGYSAYESAVAACHDRLRPILMTVFTMIVGMIPLIIESGAGANGNRSLAVGVVGGMSIGTVALLFVVPVFYIIFQNLHDRLHTSEIPANENEA